MTTTTLKTTTQVMTIDNNNIDENMPCTAAKVVLQHELSLGIAKMKKKKTRRVSLEWS